MKRFLAVMTALMLCLLLPVLAAFAQGSVTYGTLKPIPARPNQKLALRSGPGTKYSEIFSIAAASVEDFAIYQQEKGGSTMWGMIEFTSRYGRYRVYTGMKRIDTDAALVPAGNAQGVMCRVGEAGTQAYYGPGEHYAPVETRVPGWTDVTVYHEEDGWVMADFVLPDAKDDQYDEEQKQLTRAWLPVYVLSGYESLAAQEEWYDCEAETDPDGWYDWEYELEEVG